jgi:hypothetical protein
VQLPRLQHASCAHPRARARVRSRLEAQTRDAKDPTKPPARAGLAAACACCCGAVGSTTASCSRAPACTRESPDLNCCGGGVSRPSRAARYTCGWLCACVGCTARGGACCCAAWAGMCGARCGCLNTLTKWPAIGIRWFIILLCEVGQQFTAYVWLNDWSAEARRAFVGHLPELLQAMNKMSRRARAAKAGAPVPPTSPRPAQDGVV